MQFIVHVDYELSHVPHAYHNGRPGMTTIVEPGKVDWQLMEKNLRCQGYKGKADLYYIKPGCVPPEEWYKCQASMPWKKCCML